MGIFFIIAKENLQIFNKNKQMLLFYFKAMTFYRFWSFYRFVDIVLIF